MKRLLPLCLAITGLPLAALSALAAALPPHQVLVVSTPEKGAVPDAEISPDGTLHVAYVKGENTYYVSSRDGGRAFTEPLRINSEENTVHPANMFRGPDIAIGKHGRVHAIWYGNAYQRKRPQSEWGVFYAHLDPGAANFSKTLNLNHKPSDNFSLAANSDGSVAVIWMAGKLFVTESRDNGDTFLAAQTVEKADVCECCASRALFGKKGELLIEYRDKASNIRDMHLLTRDQTGGFGKVKLSGEPWNVTGCPMTGGYLAPARVGAVAAWETKGKISFARVETPLGNSVEEVRVAEGGKWPIALAAPDGTVLVSWKTTSDLCWQLFDAGNNPVDGIQSRPAANSMRHGGAVDRYGNFVLID